MRRLLTLVLGLVVDAAFAGEPLATDDASVLDPGTCQVESWHRWSNRGGHVGWLVPACSVTDRIELGLGWARYREPEESGHTLFLLQAKTVLYHSPDDRWSAGAVAAAVHDTGRETRRKGFHEAAALGLLSFNALDETLRLHVNAGVIYSQAEDTTAAWGTAFEYDFREGWTAMGELYRDSPGRPSYQVGVRYLLITDRVELFLSGGDRLHGNSDSWFAKFGVRFQTWKLF